MKKRILITGSTDGIGLLTAKMMAKDGYDLIVHGRSQQKVDQLIEELKALNAKAKIEGIVADLSSLKAVQSLADEIKKRVDQLDVLINNAGVYKTSDYLSQDGFEIRYAVNTLAPYLLTKLLLPIMNQSSRVINLSSAAQAPISLQAIDGSLKLSDAEVYAQSKLAITMWSFELSKSIDPIIIAVNPKSLLGSKMVKEAYGINGGDLNIGANILYKLSLLEEHKDDSGKYYDNDIASFSNPHPDAMNTLKCQALIQRMDEILKPYL